ncbi:MAG: selenide, water dikinase SelD [Chloroflexi bacterium]|nr:selenide, water dikinase SelD [Chloroflexota bacterium]
MNGADPHPDLLVGFENGDDAAVYRLDDRVALVLTVDFFAPIVDDPFTYGAIAAANALSDVYAIGGRPITALNIAAFPRSLPADIPTEILRGGAAKIAEAGAIIVGGHTVDDDEPKYGLSVVGVVEPGRQIQNSTAQPGDVLVLTKPIGTGVVTTALKNDIAVDDCLDAAVETMLRLNREAAEAMVSAGASAATDVTGFGVVGHLMTMMRASGTTGQLNRSAIPVLPGVERLLQDGVAPGGTHRNIESCTDFVSWDIGITETDKLLLCDPQTSGGLLISISGDSVDRLSNDLNQRGIVVSVVGEVTAFDGKAVNVSN